MQDPDLLDCFLRPLEKAGVESYMVSGSVAAIHYGEPRSTLDVDLDVDIAMAISVARVPVLVHAFPTPDYYLPPEDVVAIEIHRKTRGHFKVIHIKSGLKADFYPSTNHPFFRWAMENRRRVRIGNLDFWIAPPEYVILWKMEFFREGGGDKHMRDIQGILAVMDKKL